MQQLKDLYTQWRGHAPKDIERLPGAGSNRAYYRLWDTDGSRVIGVVGTNAEENRAFIALSRHFSRHQLPVPTVLAVSADAMRYLQTDLGCVSLFDRLKSGRESGGCYNAEERALLERTIRELPRMQMVGAREMDWSCCYPQPAFDRDSVLFDLNYFKYCFLKPSGVEFHEVKLEAAFRLLAKELTSEDCDAFLYRDFQARNIMLDAEGNPHFIDFQGGRRGPFYYDLASFLWQASAHYSHKLRRDLVRTYYEALAQYTEVPQPRHFVARLSLFVLFRTLQVLGAYGYRGYFERKQHFIDSIPGALQNLRELLDFFQDKQRATALPPYLLEVLQGLASKDAGPTNRSSQSEQSDQSDRSDLSDKSDSSEKADQPEKPRLTVRVFSFSFKRGIPADESGNGGGYVFDCRSTHNPGRYEPYKKLTGLDEPVIRFLEDDGEILTFLQSVYPLADHHVERFLQRGFTDLMFCFGCTGGQHRSVYSAQHLAEHLNNKYGVEVRICHREQNISQTLPAK